MAKFEQLTPERWLAQNFPSLKYDPNEPKCSEQCQRCHYTYEQQEYDGFPVNCDLTYDLNLWYMAAEGHFDNISQEEKHEMYVHHDPVLWAKVYLNWEPRWYQEELLRCSSRRKVVRMGRRTGKTATIGVVALFMAAHRIGAPNEHSPYQIMIVTPADVQLLRIWRDIIKLIDGSPHMTALQTRRFQDPVRTVEFSNGSVIQLMVANPNVRGQDANAIFVDEADYCDDDFIADLYPITFTHPNVFLWVSSTPTGFRTNFWKYCTHKDLGFKEFHYPSYVLPHYDARIEYEFRQLFSDIEYDHEVKAEFGEAQAGVFKKEHIAACFEKFKYSYNDCNYKNPMQEYRIMGVDWNEQHGVHIVIARWNGALGALQLEHKEIVRHSEYTMTRGVDKIIQLQTMWKCNHIYVDSGAGKMAVETLRLYGEKYPHTGLKRIVKEVQFGGSIQVRVPGARNEYIKKSVKPFVVNCAARRLEDVKVAFPMEERPNTVQTDDGIKTTTLGSQMEEFKIERITPTGVPVYSQGEDHTLVAWMCAVYGFVKENTDVVDKSTPNKIDIRVVPIPGQTKNDLLSRMERMKQIHSEMREESESTREYEPKENNWFRNVKQERDSRGNLPKRRSLRHSQPSRRNLPPRGSMGVNKGKYIK